MQSMGFSGEEAEQALFRTGNKSVTDACEYMLDESVRQAVEAKAGAKAGADADGFLGADGLPSAPPALAQSMTEPIRPSTMSPLLGPGDDGA